jgi:hypothetical protein
VEWINGEGDLANGLGNSGAVQGADEIGNRNGNRQNVQPK